MGIQVKIVLPLLPPGAQPALSQRPTSKLALESMPQEEEAGDGVCQVELVSGPQGSVEGIKRGI